MRRVVRSKRLKKVKLIEYKKKTNFWEVFFLILLCYVFVFITASFVSAAFLEVFGVQVFGEQINKTAWLWISLAVSTVINLFFLGVLADAFSETKEEVEKERIVGIQEIKKG